MSHWEIMTTPIGAVVTNDMWMSLMATFLIGAVLAGLAAVTVWIVLAPMNGWPGRLFKLAAIFNFLFWFTLFGVFILICWNRGPTS